MRMHATMSLADGVVPRVRRGALPEKALARSNALKSLDADRYPRIRFRANDIDYTGDGSRLRLTWQRLAHSGNTSLRAVVHAAAVEAESVHKPPGLARGRSSTSTALNWGVRCR